MSSKTTETTETTDTTETADTAANPGTAEGTAGAAPSARTGHSEAVEDTGLVETAAAALAPVADLIPPFLRRARPHRPVLRLVREHPAWTVGTVWAAVMVLRLFLGGAVGMADNFDGHRLMCQLGVAPHPHLAPVWAFITPRYDAYTWYGEACSAGGSGQPYYSTEYFPLLAAKVLTWCLHLPGTLDLRVLGPLFAVAVGVAVGWTAHLLPGALWVRLLVASGLGFATVDSAVAPYFVSPLSEPAALIGMLFLIPATLHLLRRDIVRARDVALLAGIALWTIGAKEQTATILVAVIPVLLLRPGRVVVGGTGSRLARFVIGCRARRAALAVCGLLAVGTWGFQTLQPRWLNEMVRYDAVFGQILGHSHDVRGDLRALGLPTALEGAAGSTMVSPDTAAGLPQYQDFLDHDGMGTVLGFYATHPTRLFGLADEGMAGVSSARPSYLGNYEAGGGHVPYAHECRICLAESLFTMAEPVRWAVFPALWGGTLLLGWFVARRGRSASAKATGVVLAATAGALIVQFWAVMLSEGGSDLPKHMVFVIYGTLMLGPLFVAAMGGYDQPAADVSDSIPQSAPDPRPAPESGHRSGLESGSEV